MMTVAIVLVVVWALGLLTSHAMGGMVHLLLLAALIVAGIHVIRGKKLLG